MSPFCHIAASLSKVRDFERERGRERKGKINGKRYRRAQDEVSLTATSDGSQLGTDQSTLEDSYSRLEFVPTITVTRDDGDHSLCGSRQRSRG